MSWIGIEYKSGEVNELVSGITMTWFVYLLIFFNPNLSVIIIINPPLALISWILVNIFWNCLSDGAKTITGVLSSISANGPCLSSPAAYPSQCLYVISFNLSAPSSAICYISPLPI